MLAVHPSKSASMLGSFLHVTIATSSQTEPSLITTMAFVTQDARAGGRFHWPDAGGLSLVQPTSDPRSPPEV